MAFSNSVELSYPVEEVFKLFIRTAKRDFPRFNEENPVGCKVNKKVGAYSAGATTMEVEITGFAKNELYQIVSTNGSVKYTSTYEFEVIDENTTRLTLIEEDEKPGIFPWFNTLVQSVLFKGRVRKRFIYFVERLEEELQRYRSNIEKNSKSRADEEAKIKAKAEAKKAKEAAQAAKIAAAKAIAEAKAAAEQAEKAAKEAEAKSQNIEYVSEEVVVDETTTNEGENN
ncbi:DUF3284 domain-containing protein [Clostridium sp.]|uniref:DUF3284 domain-containing protein n=1 Tax=Clostridium sp. TaxID=1506 RepID=UPI000667B443|nr:DUF3284 domain-containing protein [Clostridium sp.]MBS7129622.1 DUF3284 domain-containing protein [Clostridium sp.]MDU2283119.1 DUF3284 domain-containing protein [Clostridium sp.]